MYIKTDIPHSSHAIIDKVGLFLYVFGSLKSRWSSVSYFIARLFIDFIQLFFQKLLPHVLHDGTLESI